MEDAILAPVQSANSKDYGEQICLGIVCRHLMGIFSCLSCLHACLLNFFDLFAEGGTGFNAKPDANKPLTRTGPEVPEGSASKAMEDPVLTPTQGSTAKPGKNLLCSVRASLP